MQAKPFYEFGPFRLDTAEHQLLRDGRRVPLTPKAFETLLVLVQNSGHLVEKDKLMKEVWPDSFVEEANLDGYISKLRKALGEGRADHQDIETIPKRGYRFVAGVSEVRDNGVHPAVEEHSRVRTVIREGKETISAVGDVGVERSIKDEVPTVAPLVRSRASGLTWLVLIVCAATIGLGIVVRFWPSSRSKQMGAATAVRSIAVLPFKPLVAEGRDESLELGMADILITRLSTIREVIVRPMSAVRRYTGLEQDGVAVGKELGVEAVLDGSLQQAGERVRVTVRLVRVADGRTLWADKFDEKFTDIFTVQDAISEQVASALSLRLSGEERRQLAKRDTENTEAYQLYLKGRYFLLKRKEEAARKSIRYFEQAIAIDPEYALAYSGLADAYSSLHFYVPAVTEQFLPQAKTAALKALALDDTLAEAHTSLGIVKQIYDLDFAGAEREYRRAIELNPNYVSAHRVYGVFLTRMGRIDEAHVAFRRALELDPLLLLINADAGMPFYRSRKFDQAVEQYRKTIEMDPHFARVRRLLAHCYTQMGKYEEAIVEVQQAIALSAPAQRAGGRPLVDNQLAYIYAKAGRVREARQMLDEMERPPNQRFIKPYFHALAYAALGDRERTFVWLERLYEVRDHDLLGLTGDPAWDGLRGDARFQDLLRRMGLAQ